jgi:hypothetical protein
VTTVASVGYSHGPRHGHGHGIFILATYFTNDKDYRVVNIGSFLYFLAPKCSLPR